MQTFRRLRPVLAVMLFCALLIMPAIGSTWNDSVFALAQRIASKTGQGTAVTLSVTNVSSLSAADVNAIHTQLLAELKSSGVLVVKPEQSIGDVRVTISQNNQAYVWVAEIRQGNSADTVITTVVRPARAQSVPASTMTIQPKLLLAEDEPILDVALTGTDADRSAIVLTPSRISNYRISNSGWQEVDFAPITHLRPFPRDVRGVIVGAGNNPFEVALQRLKCTITGDHPIRSDCVETDDPWPLPGGNSKPGAFFSPARNFFTGVLSRGEDSTVLNPFYSAAAIGSGEWLLVGTDGQISYSNLVSSFPVATANWGSEITSIKSKCSSPDVVVLATQNGDYTQPDTLQGFKIVDHEAVAVTTTVEFSGPITAVGGAEDSAIVISRNLKTGRYEAYSISMACNQ